MIDRLRFLHPRRAGIGQALARAIPVLDDAGAKAERRLLRRIDLKEAVRK